MQIEQQGSCVLGREEREVMNSSVLQPEGNGGVWEGCRTSHLL